MGLKSNGIIRWTDSAVSYFVPLGYAYPRLGITKLKDSLPQLASKRQFCLPFINIVNCFFFANMTISRRIMRLVIRLTISVQPFIVFFILCIFCSFSPETRKFLYKSHSFAVGKIPCYDKWERFKWQQVTGILLMNMYVPSGISNSNL